MDELWVVGVDGSPNARSALAWALRRGAAAGATVRVVTAYTWPGPSWYHPAPPSQERTAAHQLQDDEIEAVTVDVEDVPRLERWIVEGEPGNVLVEAAADADLLVLGSRGRGRLSKALLGSIAEDCLRRSVAPVVVIPASVCV